MNHKFIAGLLAIGLLIGGAVTYPLSKATQTVRTVYKTKTQTAKIANGMPLGSVISAFNTPAGETVKPTAKNNYIECVYWSDARSSTPQRGNWTLTLCVKTK